MATISHVQDALADLITAALYPVSPTSSVVGHKVKIYPGWPDPGTLDIDMVETAGVPAASHVSIYPLPAERNTTRYQGDRSTKDIKAATYGLSLNGQVATVTGAAPATYFPHSLALIINGYPYLYQATAGQTAAQVASGLQAAVATDFPGATQSGAQITLPAGARVGPAIIGTVGDAIREVRRQEKQVQIAVWSSNPTSRGAVADAFDPILADTPFLTLADGTQGRLTYHGSREDDFAQKQRIYRRSLIFTVEYPTTIIETATQIVVPSISATNFAAEPMFAVPSSPAGGGALDGLLDWSMESQIDLLPPLI